MKNRTYREDIVFILIVGLVSVALGIWIHLAGTFSTGDQIETIAAETIDTDIVFTESKTEPTIERTSLGEFRVTAYCPCSDCCGEWADGITYTGTIATEKHTIAVDPSVIPLGSIVEINGVEYVAEDIGGAIKGNRADIFFNSHEDALKWGVRYCETYILEEVKS